MTVANAPTASGHVATKAYVDAASGSSGMYMLDEDDDGSMGYFKPNGDTVLNMYYPPMYVYHDCDDSDADIRHPADESGGCDADKDGLMNASSSSTSTAGFDLDDNNASEDATGASILFYRGAENGAQ